MEDIWNGIINEMDENFEMTPEEAVKKVTSSKNISFIPLELAACQFPRRFNRHVSRGHIASSQKSCLISSNASSLVLHWWINWT